MSADVIEVDFEARRRESMSVAELMGEARDAFGEVATEIGDIARQVRWIDWQWTCERRRVASLRRALEQERARSFPYTDTDVLDALRRVYVGAPVDATSIAALLDRRPTHSITVRVGLALGRLSRSGLVERAGRKRSGDRSSPWRWVPTGGGRDDAS